MKKDLTIGGIGARSTSVRRRIMKRVCKENVSGVKTNLVMSDIADVTMLVITGYNISFGKLKQSLVIKDGQTLNLKPQEILFVETSKSITNNGTINTSMSQIFIADFIDYDTPPNSGGGSLVNNGNLILSLDSSIQIIGIGTLTNNASLTNTGQIQITGTLTNNVSLTNTGQIYVNNGGIFTNIGSITNTGTINIANGSGTCGIGTFTAGSYIGTTGTGCPS